MGLFISKNIITYIDTNNKIKQITNGKDIGKCEQNVLEKYNSMEENYHDELIKAIPYIYSQSTDVDLKLNNNISFFIKPSELPSKFIKGKHMGLFTKIYIEKGTIIMPVPLEQNNNSELIMNDGSVDLEPILSAYTSEQTYQAWIDMKKTYYDLDKIKRTVNVRIISNKNKLYYEAIQDIPENNELIRLYGFSTWIFELFDILTNKNIVGFAQFVDLLSKCSDRDPYKFRIKCLRETLTKCGVDNIYNLNLYDYDNLMKNKAVIYMGKKIKIQYVLEYKSELQNPSNFFENS